MNNTVALSIAASVVAFFGMIAAISVPYNEGVEQTRQVCVESGMQWIDNSCIK